MNVPAPPSSAHLIRRAWAPVLAGIFIGALYWSRVDSVFYFLYGAHAQGLLLADAIAQGQGFIDPSLPGSPAHVREPPLFYLMLAGLIKTFGMRMYPMKVLMWSSYVAAAVLGTVFLQRRTKPWLAFLVMILFMTNQDLFRLFTGPGSDISFIALCFASLLAIEGYIDRLAGGANNSRAGLVTYAAGAAALIICAIFIRTLGIAIVMGACGALIIHRMDKVPLRSRIIWASILAAPVMIALGAWAIRGAQVPNPAGYNYLDWFLMAFAPDSLEMIAVDYHAPLMGEIQRTNIFGLILRGLRHSAIYIHYTVDSIAGMGLLKKIPYVNYLIAFGLFGLILAGLYRTEKGRAPAVPFFICIYFAVIIVWPMDDTRLVFPLLPFFTLYFAAGLYALVDLAFGKMFKTGKSSDDNKSLKSRRAGFVRNAVVLVMAGLIACNLYYYLNYHRTFSRMPTVAFKPGLQIRFMNKQAMDSFKLLVWARDHIPPGALLMYHSTPPCRFFTGHVCQSIPFTDNLEAARNFIVEGGANYLVIDEWGRFFTAGPGWFVENILRPVVRIYPDDFETVFEIPGSEARIMRVKKKAI